MNLPKLSFRGTSLLKYDVVNKVLVGQWNNNKVISFISTLRVFGMMTIQCQVGSTKVDFEMLQVPKCYSTDNYMGGVDNINKDKRIVGSFTSRSMFKNVIELG